MSLYVQETHTMADWRGFPYDEAPASHTFIEICKGKNTDFCCAVMWSVLDTEGRSAPLRRNALFWELITAFAPVESNAVEDYPELNIAVFKCLDTTPFIDWAVGHVRQTTSAWLFECHDEQTLVLEGPKHATAIDWFIERARCQDPDVSQVLTKDSDDCVDFKIQKLGNIVRAWLRSPSVRKALSQPKAVIRVNDLSSPNTRGLAASSYTRSAVGSDVKFENLPVGKFQMCTKVPRPFVKLYLAVDKL